MKTLVLTLAMVVLATLLFAQFPQSEAPDSCCFVSNDLRVAIIQINDSTVSLKMAKKPGELVKVRVKEDGKKLLYTRRIKKYSLANLVYDIHLFPQGEYVFEIVKDKKIVFSKKIIRRNLTKAYAINKKH